MTNSCPIRVSDLSKKIQPQEKENLDRLSIKILFFIAKWKAPCHH
ncbi:hypothetical protein HSIEG1_3231 [Enterococcus sp. HSIEG1]|nr:hypothetical protein HSIEG1_3231 [Enterococcus sp. HSIEG1]